MPKRLNKDTMVKLRKHHDWTQGDLAKQTGLSVKTLQRAEKEGVASEKTLRKIAGVLGVDPLDMKKKPEEALSKVGEASSSSEQASQYLKENYPRVSFHMSRGARGALKRTCQRYGVKPVAIFDLAPALFTLLAEMSLKKRKERLGYIKERLSELEGEYSGTHDLLENLLLIGSARVDEALYIEESSIRDRKLFEQDDDFYSYNVEESVEPFTAFLNEISDQIPDEVLGGFKERGITIDYRCCEGEEEQKIREEYADSPYPWFIEHAIGHCLTAEEAKKEFPEWMAQQNKALQELFPSLLPEGEDAKGEEQ